MARCVQLNRFPVHHFVLPKSTVFSIEKNVQLTQAAKMHMRIRNEQLMYIFYRFPIPFGIDFLPIRNLFKNSFDSRKCVSYTVLESLII
jgi:hypothetical protein